MSDFIKVRALIPCYVGDGPNGNIYRPAGDVFTIGPRIVEIRDAGGKLVMEDGKPKTRVVMAMQQFSSRAMEIVPDDVPEVLTTAQAAINRETQDLKDQHVRTIQPQINPSSVGVIAESAKRGPGRPPKTVLSE